MTPQARAILREVAEKHGVPVEKIVVAGRVQKIFRARMEAAIRLDAETGYSSPQIGRILGCDHTMILYYLGRLKRKPSKLRWKKPSVKDFHPNMGMKRGPRSCPGQLLRYAGFDPNEYQFNRYRHSKEERA
jgi:hypothetical protein